MKSKLIVLPTWDDFCLSTTVPWGRFPTTHHANFDDSHPIREHLACKDWILRFKSVLLSETSKPVTFVQQPLIGRVVGCSPCVSTHFLHLCNTILLKHIGNCNSKSTKILVVGHSLHLDRLLIEKESLVCVKSTKQCETQANKHRFDTTNLIERMPNGVFILSISILSIMMEVWRVYNDGDARDHKLAEERAILGSWTVTLLWD